ncbi:MAG TPA: DUF434 domain-containing protein [Anaerohalosphaeraceae bacterium]|nr:DUF434 domain-containing protein [Anaerohalosphaeraceae bacterium]HOL32014.1 DUF434 domain-containing protein [Anaerohalosphaeraceae bacterium]HOM74882.1 DUF434 domain-containing protein [Anaerohalosphaeraceae bacterium]HPC63845.1 DUF434 domain-containing protein [Anaerohalosphaeraceae bacterium]HPO68686.1 DUF434 domain-containing protein [Anaerohalosphaeraceae bacterium]
MPDKRSHRGPHPDDAALFTDQSQFILAKATADMSWLLSRGYAEKSSLKLIGDRYNLKQRQRIAVMRSACSDAQLHRRRATEFKQEKIKGQPLILDGYNLLITIEAALGGGILLIGRDGCIRDLASIHGTYRKVEETLPAIGIIADTLNRLEITNVTWLLDRPVSNSGRLKNILMQFAQSRMVNWTVELVQSPDKTLIESGWIIATSDSAVLDSCLQWLNLGKIAIESLKPNHRLRLFDMRMPESSSDTI